MPDVRMSYIFNLQQTPHICWWQTLCVTLFQVQIIPLHLHIYINKTLENLFSSCNHDIKVVKDVCGTHLGCGRGGVGLCISARWG